MAVPVFLAALAFAVAIGAFRGFATAPILLVTIAGAPTVAVAVCLAIATALRGLSDFAAALILLVTLAGAPTVAFSACLDMAIADTPAIAVVRVVTAMRGPSTATETSTRSSAARGPAGLSAAIVPAIRNRRRRVGELLRYFRRRQGLGRRPRPGRRPADRVGTRDVLTR